MGKEIPGCDMKQEYKFYDSSTQNVSKTLLVAMAGASGAGKTESAIRIATGIAGENFAVIDTENKRALNKKNRYKFHHLSLDAPYSPENYQGAIEAAIKAGFKAIVIDSFSAEWDDEGGLQDDAATALERMSKGDPAKAERLTALAWKDPKQRHRKLMRYLRKLEIPIIFCLRAEPKIKFQKDQNGKTQVVDAGWLPITEKLFGYDMLIYALMMPENPGIPVHLKKLEPEFEAMFPVGKIITEQCGRLLADWARAKPLTKESPQEPAASSKGERSHPSGDDHSELAGDAPNDEELINDIGIWCKRKKFDTAYDLASGIVDPEKKKTTIAKIDHAKDYVAGML